MDWHFTLSDLPPLSWALVLLCGAMVGFAKTGVPGTGILSVPIMAWVFPAGPSTGIYLPMLIVGDVFAVAYYRRHAEWKYVLKPMAWAVLGIVGAFAMLRFAPPSDQAMRRLIGAIVLAMLALGLVVKHHPAAHNVPTAVWFTALVGILGGFTTMMANAAGPIWIIYLLSLRFPKHAFMGTNAWIFMLLNCFKVPFSVNLGFITAQTLLFNLAVVPAIALGAWLGIRVLERINQKAFEWAATLLAFAAAVKLLL